MNMILVAAIALALAVQDAFALPAARFDKGGPAFDLEAASRNLFPISESGDSGKCSLLDGPNVNPVHFMTSAFPTASRRHGPNVRLSFQYRLRLVKRGDHRGVQLGISCYKVGTGGCREEVQESWSARLYDTAGEWRDFSKEYGVRYAAEQCDFTLALNGGEGELEVRRLKYDPVDPDPNLVSTRLGSMGMLDGVVEIGAGQPLMLTFEWQANGYRYEEARKLRHDGWRFELTLPTGIICLDSPSARKGSLNVIENDDGSSTAVIVPREEIEPGRVWNSWYAINFLVENRHPVGETVNDGSLVVTYDGKEVSRSTVVRFRSGEPVAATEIPETYINGFDGAGEVHEFRNPAAADRYAAFICGAGVRFCGTREGFRKALAAHGVKQFHAGSSCIANGYMVGTNPPTPNKRPECERFQPYDWSAVPYYRTNLFRQSSCPVAIYKEASYFKDYVLPGLKRSMVGNSALITNWEPDAYFGYGCGCANCMSEFASYCKLELADVARDWPQCVMPGGRFADRRNRFRSWQHGLVVKTIDKYVRQFSGEEKSEGFIPEIIWGALATGLRDNPMQAEIDVYEYASSLKWINPWGPYCWWDTETPYFYEKRLPIAPFAAAKNIRENVDRRFPKDQRPKLLAFPHGAQRRQCLAAPEWIGMTLDSFFFNGWEASRIYFFPRGYDARYWRAFADATSRAGRCEKYVLNGKRTDAMSVFTPVRTYAANCKQVTAFLPTSTNMSPLQVVSYDYKGGRVVAVFNFWEKGAAFGKLSMTGLPPGKYMVTSGGKTLWTKSTGEAVWTTEELARGLIVGVGAVRTVDFEIRPASEGMNGRAKEEMTQATVRAAYEALRGSLERASERDRASEAARGEVLMDTLPQI